MFARRLLLALTGPILGASCAGAVDWVPLTVRPEPIYEQLHPYYIELCALSQIRRIGAPEGGSPGHAVMYLKGACMVADAPWPTLEVCGETSGDTADPERGVGISVNKWFRNVNWIAVPTKRLFLHGNLTPGQRLTREHFDATVQAALDAGVYRGVQIRENHFAGGDPERIREFVAGDSIGTDFALRFARSVHCVRVPVPRSMMEKVLEYLNGLNEQYATGEADYEWSGYHDNCVHTLHNALANASIWKPKSINAIKVRQFFNLAVPANTFADLARRAADYPIENPGEIEKDPVARAALTEHRWLPGRHGVLLKQLPVHQDNDLYDTQFRIFVLQNPILAPKSNEVRDMMVDGRYVEVRANLRRFKARYERILAERRDEESESDFRRRYYEYIEAQLAEVNDQTAKLTPDVP